MDTKTKYIITGSLIGGTAACLLFTSSGRHFRKSVRRFDTDAVTEKIERMRLAVEHRGRDLSEGLERVRNAFGDSIDAGRSAYEHSERDLRIELERLERYNQRVADSLHRAVDELNRTAYSIEKSLLGAVYGVKSMVHAVRQGAGTLQSGESYLREHEEAANR